ncbi:MAG TPA: hypothetical protein VEK39_15235 [Solirubrobacterales bacterium]|nr:hypothetical protein [Solirubrobacterales bacterium]
MAHDPVYDVLYIDEARHCTLLAGGLSRQDAFERARAEARERHSPRLFLRGSDSFPRSQAVVIIRSGPTRSSESPGVAADGEPPS